MKKKTHTHTHTQQHNREFEKQDQNAQEIVTRLQNQLEKEKMVNFVFFFLCF